MHPDDPLYDLCALLVHAGRESDAPSAVRRSAHGFSLDQTGTAFRRLGRGATRRLLGPDELVHDGEHTITRRHEDLPLPDGHVFDQQGDGLSIRPVRAA